ncbi:conserved hypothetical protein, partial [gamma proteobacterium HTCC5015]
FLDSKNPRHKVIQDEDEIIKELIKVTKGGVLRMAEDIAENGLNQSELFWLIEGENGELIVTEGNRRLCAVKILNDPDRCPSDHRDKIKKLAEKNAENIPDEVACSIFKNRDQVDFWLDRKHNGAQDGRGFVPWDAEAKTRFANRKEEGPSKSRNSLPLSLLDYAVRRNLISKEERESLKITTLARFLGNSFLREMMGITSPSTSAQVEINVSDAEFEACLKYFLEDALREDTPVNSRAKAPEVVKYAKEMSQKGHTPKSHDDEPHTLSVSKSDDDSKDDADNSRSKEKYRGITLVPKQFKASTGSKTQDRILKELKSLNCNTFPAASAVLCRAFLEDTYISFLEKKDGKKPQFSKSSDLLNKVVKAIQPEKSNLGRNQDKAFQALRRLSMQNSGSFLAPASLGALAHGTYYPDGKALQTEWDNIEEIVRYMLINS